MGHIPMSRFMHCELLKGEQNVIQEELGPEPGRKGYVWTTHEDLSSNP